MIGKTCSRDELERQLAVLEEQLQQQSRFAAINQPLFKIANTIKKWPRRVFDQAYCADCPEAAPGAFARWCGHHLV